MRINMTKKHFIAIAAALSEVRDMRDADPRTVDIVTEKLIIEFQKMNPRFNANQFRNAVRGM